MPKIKEQCFSDEKSRNYGGKIKFWEVAEWSFYSLRFTSQVGGVVSQVACVVSQVGVHLAGWKPDFAGWTPHFASGTSCFAG